MPTRFACLLGNCSLSQGHVRGHDLRCDARRLTSTVTFYANTTVGVASRLNFAILVSSSASVLSGGRYSTKFRSSNLRMWSFGANCGLVASRWKHSIQEAQWQHILKFPHMVRLCLLNPQHVVQLSWLCFFVRVVADRI